MLRRVTGGLGAGRGMGGGADEARGQIRDAAAAALGPLQVRFPVPRRPPAGRPPPGRHMTRSRATEPPPGRRRPPRSSRWRLINVLVSGRRRASGKRPAQPMTAGEGWLEAAQQSVGLEAAQG